MCTALVPGSDPKNFKELVDFSERQLAGEVIRDLHSQGDQITQARANPVSRLQPEHFLPGEKPFSPVSPFEEKVAVASTGSLVHAVYQIDSPFREEDHAASSHPPTYVEPDVKSKDDTNHKESKQDSRRLTDLNQLHLLRSVFLAWKGCWKVEDQSTGGRMSMKSYSYLSAVAFTHWEEVSTRKFLRKWKIWSHQRRTCLHMRSSRTRSLLQNTLLAWRIGLTASKHKQHMQKVADSYYASRAIRSGFHWWRCVLRKRTQFKEAVRNRRQRSLVQSAWAIWAARAREKMSWARKTYMADLFRKISLQSRYFRPMRLFAVASRRGRVSVLARLFKRWKQVRAVEEARHWVHVHIARDLNVVWVLLFFFFQSQR